MLHQTATLNSGMSMADAIKRLENYPDEAFVVVRRQEGDELYWYHYQVGEIREIADRMLGSSTSLETSLKTILDLHEHTSSNTVDVNHVAFEAIPMQDGVMLDGETVIGVLTSEAMAGAVGGGPATDIPRGLPRAPGGTPQTIPGPSAGTGVVPGTSPFKAYPKLQAPDGITVESAFELGVALTPEQLTGAIGAIVVEHAPDQAFDLLVQVIAPGFRTPAGTQRILHVNRSDLAANRVSFELIANDEAQQQPRRHSLEVQFSFKGEACGRAWRDITVLPAGMPVDNIPVASSGSSPISPPGGNHAPDLTISITEGDEDGRFVWLFTSPHAVDTHTDVQIETRLNNDNARSFAVKVLKGIPDLDGSDMVGMHMKGTGREIAQVMPVEFWNVLGEVWSLVHAAGKVPRLLFLSAEPYVPWELASVEASYIDPQLLDANYTTLLNAQTRVGRWLPPRPHTPRGGDRPSQPPAVRVGVNQMAVVTGDYLALNGIRPLPEAEAEGTELTRLYQAARLTATWEDVEILLENRVVHNGQQVDVELMHFACHGQVDLSNPMHNGIVLNGRNMRLDPTTARGNSIGAATQPFAFMNACEVGMAGETLGAYGGLAAAFLNEGFRGFVAPLWAINDKIAHKIALKFYEETLVKHQPVSEALRSVRLDYDPDQPQPSATALAYIFYGHPDLVLER
jgi:hypothetical protein